MLLTSIIIDIYACNHISFNLLLFQIINISVNLYLLSLMCYDTFAYMKENSNDIHVISLTVA